MFASKTPQAETKASHSPADSHAPQHSALAARSIGSRGESGRQRTAPLRRSNQALLRSLGRNGNAALPLQCKPLEIGATDDSFEREADRVAEHVRRTPAGAPPAFSTIGGSAAGARKAAPPIVEEVLQAPGEPLAPATQGLCEVGDGALTCRSVC
jgi:hypothetical protein